MKNTFKIFFEVERSTKRQNFEKTDTVLLFSNFDTFTY